MITKPPPERESKVVKAIRVRLRRLGIVLYRRNVAMHTAVHNGKSRVIRSGKAGQSDLYGWVIKTGRHVEIEVKREGEKPTARQLAWMLECHRLGAIVFWSDSANVAELVAEAVLAGGKIAWRDDGTFDVEMEAR